VSQEWWLSLATSPFFFCVSLQSLFQVLLPHGAVDPPSRLTEANIPILPCRLAFLFPLVRERSVRRFSTRDARLTERCPSSSFPLRGTSGVAAFLEGRSVLLRDGVEDFLSSDLYSLPNSTDRAVALRMNRSMMGEAFLLDFVPFFFSTTQRL